MNISKLYKKIALLSPPIQILLRKIYWKNARYLKKYRSKNNIVKKANGVKKADFANIINYLKDNNIGDGSLIIVHSSYEALSCTGLSPKEIIEHLLNLVGKNGTLAMPVIREFNEAPKYEDILTADVSNLICTYDVRKTKIITGMLPFALMRHKDSVTSRFPLNPLTAVGPLAANMMQHNLDGECPSPHGINSSWKFCYDNGAIVVSLGINRNYGTIRHVVEEAFPDWLVSDEDWYRKRIFDIRDGDFQIRKMVKERKPKWGMIYFLSEKFKQDLLKHNIRIEKEIDGITVGMIDSQKYIAFMRNKSKNDAYPYYIDKKYFNR